MKAPPSPPERGEITRRTRGLNRISPPSGGPGGAFTLFAVLPLVAGLGWAVLYSVGLVGGLSSGFTLENWQKILENAPFWASLGLSLAISLVVVVLSAALALGSLLFFKNQIFQKKARFWLHLPLAVPPMIAAFLGFQWLSNSGLATRVFLKIGWLQNLETAPELINDQWHFGVVAMLVFGVFPFFLILFSTFFQSENLENLSQLARTLGASDRQIARRVVAPVILRKALPNLVLSFIVTFGAFEVPLLLGRQSPQMISVFIAQKFRKFNLLDLPQAFAAAVVYAVVVFVLALIFLKKQSKTASF